MPCGGDPVLDDLLELLGGHAGVGGHDDFEQRLLAAGERAFHVALEQRGEGFLVLPLRMLRRERLHAVEREEDWKYIGCSAQSVPSLSNVAMRSASGTKSGEPSFGHLLDEVDDGLLGRAVVCLPAAYWIDFRAFAAASRTAFTLSFEAFSRAGPASRASGPNAARLSAAAFRVSGKESPRQLTRTGTALAAAWDRADGG